MPRLAVTAHRLLTATAAVRMAIELLDELEDPDRRAATRQVAERRLAEIEEGLKELITTPRELLLED